MAATVNQAGTVTNQFANIHGDINGSLASTDTNPNDLAWFATDAWGNQQAGGPTRYTYLGAAQRKVDTNSGLMLMGVRVYNPASGRFLQTDPVLGGSANNYDYAAGDPVNNTDLNGKWCLAGFGTTCTRYVKDKYRRTVPVQNRIRDKIQKTHGITWSTLKYMIQNWDQVSSSGTTVTYEDYLYELTCTDGNCTKTGNQVKMRLVVDFKATNGKTFGVVTAYCLGYNGLCPSWVNSPKV